MESSRRALNMSAIRKVTLGSSSLGDEILEKKAELLPACPASSAWDNPVEVPFSFRDRFSSRILLNLLLLVLVFYVGLRVSM